MDPKEIETILMNALALTEVYVKGNGGHFEVFAVDERFSILNRIKKQQVISEPLMDYIANNRIHALTIKTFTISEWNRYCALNGSQK